VKYKLLRHRLIAWYSIALGISVFILWAVILVNGNLSEGETEIGFHLASEFLMAFLCLLSGIFLLSGKNSAIKLNVAALAMIVYSLLNAAGYYFQRNAVMTAVIFLVLLVFSSAALILHFSRWP
jgi:hypothetical protein